MTARLLKACRTGFHAGILWLWACNLHVFLSFSTAAVRGTSHATQVLCLEQIDHVVSVANVRARCSSECSYAVSCTLHASNACRPAEQSLGCMLLLQVQAATQQKPFPAHAACLNQNDDRAPYIPVSPAAPPAAATTARAISSANAFTALSLSHRCISPWRSNTPSYQNHVAISTYWTHAWHRQRLLSASVAKQPRGW
jgi:hypothetical protein